MEHLVLNIAKENGYFKQAAESPSFLRMSILTRIEALNYRCLRYIDQPLKDFHVLVGPNASGKTTLLDVVAFLGKLVSDGPKAAVFERTHNFQDLVWQRESKGFELAIEARIPEGLREKLTNGDFDCVRYEVVVEFNYEKEEIGITDERVLLKIDEPYTPMERTLFPLPKPPPKTILTKMGTLGKQWVLRKKPDGNDNYYPEVRGNGKGGWIPTLRLGPKRSALGALPEFGFLTEEGELRYPVATWLKNLLTEGVQQFILNSQLIRKACPPGQGRLFKPDGSNLPWVIEDLKEKDSQRFRAWIEHVRTALPDIEDIRTVEREDDRHRYLMVCYSGGLEGPSWMVSDGTLRLLALTLPAYLTDFEGVYLIEEPENGIHPRAVQTMIQSLSSVYNAQILLATHSPVILSFVDAEDVLCFAKTPEGATDIVSGIEHPSLENWRGELNLSLLFASGVLG